MDGEILGKDGFLHSKCHLAGIADGEKWDDLAGGRVTHIAIRYGDHSVHSIQTTYEREGSVVMSRRHGGNHGDFELIKLNEPLTWVSGHYGSVCLDPEIFACEDECPWNYEKVILSLKFGTDRATYGPFGTEAGTPFSFKTATEISGFFGWSRNDGYGYLHALGVYIRCPAACFIDELQTLEISRCSG